MLKGPVDVTVRFVFCIDSEQKVVLSPGDVFGYSDGDVEALKACGVPALQTLVIVPVYTSRWQIYGSASDSLQINKQAFKQSSAFEERRQKQRERPGILGGGAGTGRRGFYHNTPLRTERILMFVQAQTTFLSLLISLRSLYLGFLKALKLSFRAKRKAESCHCVLCCSGLQSIKSAVTPLSSVSCF